MQRTPHFSAGSRLTLTHWDCHFVTGSPFRNFWAVCTPDGLAALAYNTTGEAVLDLLSDDLRFSVSRQGSPPWPIFAQLQEYLTGTRSGFEIPLDLSWMTPFQQRVLQAVSEIPCGQTAAYSRIAQSIGRPAAARAVGAANGRNPIAIMVPCHRLVGADGSLRGYRGEGGIQTKAWLLSHEQQIPGGHLRYTG
jgi:methylated-DNA-[protein]-cysteine S-methyltransferase